VGHISRSDLEFVLVDVNGDTIHARAFKPDGTEIDSLVLGPGNTGKPEVRGQKLELNVKSRTCSARPTAC